MKKILLHNLDIALDALKHFFRQAISSFFIILMLGIALTLPLSLYLAVQSAQNIMGNVSIDPQLTVFLDLSADKVDIAAVTEEIKKFDNIKSYTFKDKEVALKEVVATIGQEQFLAMLDSNPLPDAFLITPKNNEPHEIEILKSALNKLKMVDSVQMDADWVKTLYYINALLWKILLFLAFTLSVVFILISYNTIRLQILSQKEEIEVSRLLGASASYIRKPFLLQAFFQGLLTTIIGIFFSTLVIIKVTKMASLVFINYGIAFNFRWFTVSELILIFLLIETLSISGAWWAVDRHLKEFKSQYE